MRVVVDQSGRAVTPARRHNAIETAPGRTAAARLLSPLAVGPKRGELVRRADAPSRSTMVKNRPIRRSKDWGSTPHYPRHLPLR
jgi:hypothetical protein